MKYNYSVDMSTDNSLSVILRNIEPDSKVFEFGPAEGYMTEYLKKSLKCEVYCLEIDEQSAQKASEFCDKMIIADLNDPEWLKQIEDNFGTFDYIVFADVLEHLIRPEKVLRTVTDLLLKDNGKALISLPHIGHTAVIMDLMEGKFEYRDTGLLDRTHLNFFTRANVEKLLQDAGLTPIKWHNVCMHPEQTELKSNYDSIPLHVQEYLKNKIDAHVYQFITVSEKLSRVREAGIDSESSSYRYSEFIQLFWNSGDGYSEFDSIRLPLEKEENYFTYVFEFQKDKGDLIGIRLDPVNFPCFIHIRSIKLKALSSITNKYETIENISLHPMHGAELISNDTGMSVFAFNNDPQLYRDFKCGMLDDYSNFRVEVELNYTLKLDTGLLYSVQNQVDLRDLAQKVEEFKNLTNEIEQKRKSEYGLLKSENIRLKEREGVLRRKYQIKEEENELLKSELNEIKSSLIWKMMLPIKRIKRIFSKSD
ncbi:methyltransferase domain-containing protein [Paenibacillus lautus]|uniref:class I SAM-dependent methyltransferase n=1 Tax=Paenibacillus lautus TaxID=1401 RepID=UPI003D2A20FC